MHYWQNPSYYNWSNKDHIFTYGSKEIVLVSLYLPFVLSHELSTENNPLVSFSSAGTDKQINGTSSALKLLYCNAFTDARGGESFQMYSVHLHCTVYTLQHTLYTLHSTVHSK